MRLSIDAVFQFFLPIDQSKDVVVPGLEPFVQRRANPALVLTEVLLFQVFFDGVESNLVGCQEIATFSACGDD